MGVKDSFDPAAESNRKEGFLVPDAPRERRKKKNSRVKTSPEPSNRVDEEPDETDEQIPTEVESTDSLGKSSYHSVFLIACS